MKAHSPVNAQFGRLMRQACLAGAFVAFSGVAVAGGPSNPSIAVSSDPTQVSVSRVDGPSFYVNYTITVTNNSTNNNQTYDFKATTKVTTGTPGTVVNTTYAQYISSTGVPCVVPDLTTPTVVTCAKLSVNKGTSKSFTITYKTPLSGDNLRLTVEATSNAIKGSGFANTQLITIPYEQTITSFYTYVPKDGGTFYTGANGNLPGSPGAPATTEDPWTTTVYIPPINFTTTARATEGPSGVTCSGFYASDACYQTDLTIPSAPGAFQSLIIYLRIDVTKHLAIPIDFAVIQYSKDGITSAPVRNCATPTPDPLPGNPCIESRRFYDGTAPLVWQGDWEFKIRAVDNGRYFN